MMFIVVIMVIFLFFSLVQVLYRSTDPPNLKAPPVSNLPSHTKSYFAIKWQNPFQQVIQNLQVIFLSSFHFDTMLQITQQCPLNRKKLKVESHFYNSSVFLQAHFGEVYEVFLYQFQVDLT